MNINLTTHNIQKNLWKFHNDNTGNSEYFYISCTSFEIYIPRKYSLSETSSLCLVKSMYVCMYVCVYVRCMYVCVCVYIHIYIYIHTHTHSNHRHAQHSLQIFGLLVLAFQLSHYQEQYKKTYLHVELGFHSLTIYIIRTYVKIHESCIKL